MLNPSLPQESVDPGFQCYEGPFAAAGITDVLTQCQARGVARASASSDEAGRCDVEMREI